MSDTRERSPAAWAARPLVAALVRAAVVALPLVASVGFVWLISHWVEAPRGSTLNYVLWWVALSAAGSVVLVVVERAGRRVIPLATLLRLSLVFPDEAPSRFRAALEAGKVRRLEERLEALREAQEAGTPRESAERLLTLVAALSEHDRITRGHSERVRAYAVMIGEQLRLDKDEIDLLNWSALLHDVGKLEVDGEILRNPGRPSDEEWEQIKQHPLLGERIVAPMRPWLGGWTDAVGYHHERWDGKGYPHGLAGEQIPLAGRIVAIADVYDVITSARSYKAAGSAAAGREEIARCSGAQFDPRMVRAFLNVSLGRMRLVMGPLSWLAHVPVLGRVPLVPAANTVWSAVAVVAAATGIVGTVHKESQTRPGTSPVRAERIAARPAAKQVHEVDVPLRVAKTADLSPTGLVASPDAGGADDAPVVPKPVTDGTEAPPGADVVDRPAAGPTTVQSQPEQPASPAPPADPVQATPPTPAPPAGPVPNQEPSFVAGADRTVLEDAGAQSTAGWATAISAGPANESAQSVSFSVSNDNNGLFSVQPQVAPNGTLAFTPAANANGVATVTVRAVDDGGTAGGGADTSAAHTVTITVTAVNDTPGLTAGADRTVLEDAGAQTTPGWATGVSPGPANESAQNVSFSVSNNNTGLFSVQPQVQPNGTLSYTPAANANGVATVTVRAVDDGGTAGGGADTSAAQTFTITVTAVNDVPSFVAGADQLTIINSSQQTIAGWATAISAGPANESAQNVSFSVSNDNTGLFSAQPQVQPNGTLIYTPAFLGLGTATVTVRAVDDGGTLGGGVDTSAPQAFAITVIL